MAKLEEDSEAFALARDEVSFYVTHRLLEQVRREGGDEILCWMVKIRLMGWC